MSHDESTVRALQRVGVHIVARARIEATGRFSLRVSPGGFATPEFGPDLRRVGVSGTALFVESDRPGGAECRAMPIAGASLRELASFAEVDLSDSIGVGDDTPDVGDIDAPIAVDEATARAVAGWHSKVAQALVRFAMALPATAGPTLARLWPEHFDIAFDAAAPSGLRANFGGSPGDGFHPAPYLYAGPWTDARPGDPSFWNAPFGAVLRADEITGDPIEAATAFYSDVYARLS